MKWKRFIRNSNNGFSLVEMLVATSLGLVMVSITIASVRSSRALYEYDLISTRLNQNLRTSLDLIAATVREAGENLPPAFPALEVINGASGEPDELIVRRNLIDEVLKVCAPITNGGTDDLYFAVPGTTAGCIYGNQQVNFEAWQTYRNANGGQVKVYIYDPSSKLGEIFEYNSETDTGTEMFIERGQGVWENDYTVGSSAAYIIEEWHFKIDKDTTLNESYLQVIQEGVSDQPQNIAFGISDMAVNLHMQDGTVNTSFIPGDNWSLIKSVEVTLTAEEYVWKKLLSGSLTARFFPRNILSH